MANLFDMTPYMQYGMGPLTYRDSLSWLFQPGGQPEAQGMPGAGMPPPAPNAPGMNPGAPQIPPMPGSLPGMGGPLMPPLPLPPMAGGPPMLPPPFMGQPNLPTNNGGQGAPRPAPGSPGLGAGGRPRTNQG